MNGLHIGIIHCYCHFRDKNIGVLFIAPFIISSSYGFAFIGIADAHVMSPCVFYGIPFQRFAFCYTLLYVFEVSSPGLGRPLKKEKDYVRSMGKEVEIRTYRAINREKEFYGILSAYDENTVTIKTEDETEMTFEKSDIALIRLAFDF